MSRITISEDFWKREAQITGAIYLSATEHDTSKTEVDYPRLLLPTGRSITTRPYTVQPKKLPEFKKTVLMTATFYLSSGRSRPTVSQVMGAISVPTRTQSTSYILFQQDVPVLFIAHDFYGEAKSRGLSDSGLVKAITSPVHGMMAMFKYDRKYLSFTDAYKELGVRAFLLPFSQLCENLHINSIEIDPSLDFLKSIETKVKPFSGVTSIAETKYSEEDDGSGNLIGGDSLYNYYVRTVVQERLDSVKKAVTDDDEEDLDDEEVEDDEI